MSDRDAREMDPSEAFSLVATAPRFDILQALWDLTNGGSGSTVSFATLRRETGIPDSGQFNYHLDKLVPHFVRKRDDGYQLTAAGRRILGAAVSGVYTDLDVSMDPITVRDCPECDGLAEARYDEGLIAVTCQDCGTKFADMSVPPVLVSECDAADLPRVLGRHFLTEIQRMHRGFCTDCGGPLDATVLPRAGETFSDDWNVHFTCRTCGGESWSVVTGAVLDHPAVTDLLREAGYDLREAPLWEIPPVLDATETVVNEDPVRVRVAVATTSAALDLTVDENLDVVDVERREGDAP